jgi:hypothetical protein
MVKCRVRASRPAFFPFDRNDQWPTMQQYVRYDPSVEVEQPDEDALTRNILASIARLNQEVFDFHRHAVRQAHAKSHGVLKGELTVYPGLPPHLRQGLFATPKTYPVIIRFSTAPGNIQSDNVPSNCGMAIKALGVAGLKADPDDASQNQDILLVNSPVYFGDVAAYWKVQQIIEKQTGGPEEILAAVEFIARGAKDVLGAVGLTTPIMLRALAAPGNHILGETFHSMAAIRFGDYIAKLSAAPLSPSVRSLTGIPAHGSDSVLRDLVVEFFSAEAAEYEIRAQLCADIERMPVENASVQWPDDLSPQQPIGKIAILPQDAYSPARRVYADDVLSFTPWRCLEAHRPLGSIMRLRLKAYEASSRFRHAMNASPRLEPHDISELPD